MVNVLLEEKSATVNPTVPMVPTKIRASAVRIVDLVCSQPVTRSHLARYNCRPTEYRCLSGGCIPYVERCDRKIG
jgi:hypothetical protein